MNFYITSGPELQIRVGFEDYCDVILLIPHKNVSCDCTLERSHRAASKERSQPLFL